MQSVSASWGAIFNAPHKVEYRFDIAGATYYGDDVKGTPVIVKPLIDKPAIGRVCTGSLKLSIYPKSANIPKAAAVDAYCRLRNTTDGSVSEWLRQGRYYITTRTGKDVINLSCLDCMVKAGITYRDNSRITEWPASMTDVVDEICDIMGVSLDSRTVIETGSDYVVSYPNDDVLISEVLGMIAAAHGGNWIMTEAGDLRLVVLSAPKSTAAQVVGKTHKGFTSRGKTQTVSRVILKDSANNEFIAGDETGLTISVKCDYATQDIANDLCSASASSTLYGIQYEPYAVDGAYLNPAVELDDTLFFTDKDGTVHRVVAYTVNMNCTVACTCSLSALIDDETENEYPYKSPRDLALERTVRTDQTYFGNSLTRENGFVSELLINGEAKARLRANASVFSMQATDAQGNWQNRIYFDTQTGKYVITADVTIQGAVTFEDLANAGGQTIINGGNITTGILKSADGSVQLNLDTGAFTVKGKNVAEVLASVENGVTIVATSQIFSRASGETSYSPSSITLTAQTAGTLVSYAWYKDNTLIAGATTSTLQLVPADIAQGRSSTYKVVGTDTNGNTFTDYISIAKISDGTDGEPGAPGSPGKNTATVYLYKRATSASINWTTTLTYDFTRNALTSLPSGWSATIPTGTNPVWMTSALAASTGNTDTIAYTEWATPAKIAQNGSPGTPGTNGIDGYTVILSDEYCEIPVNTERKPLAAGTRECTVSVYKGMTALTPTLSSTVDTGQFKVTATNTIPGVTVTQTVAGTLQLTVSTETAIPDSATLALAITVYEGLTITAYIAIKANMNSVTATQQTAIEANAQGLLLKVSKGSIISEINQSAEQITISASKVDLTGYVTITGLTSGSTTIDGACIKTGSISATRISGGTLDASEITVSNLSASSINSGSLSATYISGGILDCNNITVKNLSASSITTGTMSASRLSGGTIDASQITVSNINASNIKSGSLSATYISGGTLDCSLMTVKNLSASSITTGTMSANRLSGGTIDASQITVSNINASNIKSGSLSANFLSGGTIDASQITVKNLDASQITAGTMSADRIDATNLHVQKIYTYSSNYYTALKTSGTTYLYIGGDGTWNMSYVSVYASQYIEFKNYNWSYGLRMDLYSTESVFRPMTASKAALGSSTYPFSDLHVGVSSTYHILIANNQLRPTASSSTYPSYLGTSSYPWMYAYLGSTQVQLGTSTSSKVGFFGATPVARKSQSTSSATTVAAVNTVLNNLINNLKGYGLLS